MAQPSADGHVQPKRIRLSKDVELSTENDLLASESEDLHHKKQDQGSDQNSSASSVPSPTCDKSSLQLDDDQSSTSSTTSKLPASNSQSDQQCKLRHTKLDQFSDRDSSSSAVPSPFSDHLSSPKKNKQSTSLSMELRNEPDNIWRISDFARLQASAWNGYAGQCYEAFKVERYIVNPNYIMCVSKDPSPTWYHPTVDYLLERIDCSASSTFFSFPSWKSVEEQLLRILPVFDFKDCLHIPYKLRSVDDTVAFMTKFKEKIMAIPKDVSDTSAFDQFIVSMSYFCEKFIEAARLRKLHEHLYAKYLHILVTFFSRTTQVPIDYQTSDVLSLDLTAKKGEEGKVMEIKPDILVTFRDVIILVGEAKRFGDQSKKLDNHKGHRVLSSAEQSDQIPKEEGDLAGSSTDYIWREVNVDVDDKDLIHDDFLSETVDEEIEPVNDTSKNTSDTYVPYRKLDCREKSQVDGILPQLLAEMLACMAENKKKDNQFRFCRQNEDVQIGLTLNGFRVRFVRLVLHNTKSKGTPCIDDIRDPCLRCSVFLTQELNLFKPTHITMVFKILHALVYMNSRACQWQR